MNTILYETLIKNISLSIKLSLNEMAKKIDHRTIDRKLWLSVASVCSRNKSTEAEFVKPMKKLTKDDLLNRYIAALLIMKKPCPKSEKEIETLKTLKLFAYKAIELGATILDIQNLYNVNAGISAVPVSLKKEPLKTSDLFNDEIFNTDETQNIVSDKLSLNTITAKINRKLDTLANTILNNKPLEFANILNDMIDTYDELRYNKSRRRWSLYVGKEKTWCPSISRTKYENYYEYNIKNGHFSYENKKKVINDGENIFNALDNAYKWKEGYDFYSRYDCYSDLIFSLYSQEDEDKDELSFSINIHTGPECKTNFIEILRKQFTKACEALEDEQNAQNNFDPTKYEFNKTPLNYPDWVSKYLPIILKNNNLTEGNDWYIGIDINTIKCKFWTGKLEMCTPVGIKYWVGGDSTDDDGMISYNEWRRCSGFLEYSSHAEVGINISYKDKVEYSEKIYNYIKKLVMNGKLK